VIVLFEVHPGPTVIVYVDGVEVARKHLGFPEVRRLIGDLLRHS